MFGVNARSILRTLVGVNLALSLAACSKPAFYASPLPPDPPPGPTDPVVGELPPQTFTARPHERRVHPRPTAAPAGAVAKLKLGGRCVPAGAVPEGRPSTTGSQRVADNHVPYQPAKPKAKGSPPSPVGGAAKSASAPAAEAEMPEPPPQPTAPPSMDDAAMGASAEEPPADSADRSSRRDRRAERKRRRQEKQQGPLAPSAPPSEAPIAVEPEPPLQVVQPELPPPEHGWGQATYLSNDDSMSLSSAQRVIFAIDEFLPLPVQHIRPHELLNYFSFEGVEAEPGHDFGVHAQLAPSSRSPGLYTLAMDVASRPVGRRGRRNVNLTLVVDRSGSMAAEGRMEYLKRGLLRMVRELKDGDVVHLVTFDHRVCVPMQNFMVGRDDSQVLIKAIHDLRPSGRTNLHAGLTRGYQLADSSYQAQYSNRVLVVTDALANTGVTDARTLSLVTDWFDARRIRLSGIGVGKEFNDALLDELTEKGRGAYVFLGSEAEVDAIFGEHFTSLVETVANDVHFRLHLPSTLRMAGFHGEEASTRKADVQAVHFFADTSQLFLADLEPWQGRVRDQDGVMLEIEYLHPETGERMVEEYAFEIAEILEADRNVRKGELIMEFIDGIARMAARGAPTKWEPRPGTWRDAQGLRDCQSTRTELSALAEGLNRDPEVVRVEGLWDRFCSRFEGPGGPRPGRKLN